MIMKKLGVILVMLALFAVSSWGQTEYSTSATLVSSSDEVLTLQSLGVSDKKKEAVPNAIKSAFYTLFYRGISGYNNNKPLIQRNNQYYVDKFLDNRYTMFVRSSKTLSEPEKLSDTKQYKAQVEVSILIKALVKDLVFEKLMDNPLSEVTMEDTKKEIGLPSIMVVPYKKEDESYQSILQNDFDRRMAVSKVQDGFNQLGVTTVDFEGRLNAMWRSMDFNANTADSDEKSLLMNSDADVYVIVDIQKDISSTEGSRVSLNMKAYETASGNILASRQEWTNRFHTTELDRLCVYAVEGQLKGFLDDIALNFARTIGDGTSVVLHIAKGPQSKLDLNSQVGPQKYILSSLIRRWVRANAQDGRFHLRGLVPEAMIFDDIKIPSKDADGLPMDAAQFGDNLLFYLNSEVGVPCEMKLDGKTIYITLN